MFINRAIVFARLMIQPKSVTTFRGSLNVRYLAQARPPTGGPSYLAAFVEDLKKRGFEESSNIHSQNIFKLFKLEQKLMINESQLKREYMRLQRSIHPDKFVNSDTGTQNQVLRLSSIVNEAYETLRHPYKRAKYLVSLTMGKGQEELETRLNLHKLDDKFLARMMELREQAELSYDNDALLRISAEIEDEINKLFINMKSNFEESKIEALVGQLGKLKFLGNLHVKLSERTENFSKF